MTVDSLDVVSKFGCPRGVSRAAYAFCDLGSGHGLEDLDHSVDPAMRAGRHAADASQAPQALHWLEIGSCAEAAVTVL